MRLAHAPEALASIRTPSEADPLRILVSGCLAGLGCGVDGTDYGLGRAAVTDLFGLDVVRVVSFCPEDHGIGTPRTMPDIHGGDGFDVLDGRARVLDEHGVDLTEPMRRGAQAMVERAQEAEVELAILTDMSAACGSQVISDGCRLVAEPAYQLGVGVAAAALLRAGVPVVSQRDFWTLEQLRSKLIEGYEPDPEARDHHQHPWTKAHFGL